MNITCNQSKSIFGAEQQPGDQLNNNIAGDVALSTMYLFDLLTKRSILQESSVLSKVWENWATVSASGVINEVSDIQASSPLKIVTKFATALLSAEQR